MAGKKPKILEADRLVIGDADGTRTEVTAGELKMYGDDGTLRVRVQAEDDGDYRAAHIGLFTPENDNDLDPVVSISAHGDHSWIDLYVPRGSTPELAVQITSGPSGPEITFFDENDDVIFAAPETNRHKLWDELAGKLAELIDSFVTERGLNCDATVGYALECAPSMVDRLRAARETESAS